MITDELVTTAYYLSGVRSRDFETVTGSQLADGLLWLNLILSENSSNGTLIPYFNYAEFDTVPGQEEYFVEGLIELDALTFTLDQVRYATARRSRRRYNGENRVEGLRSLPFTYNVERTINGSNVFFYYLPDRVYKIRVTGTFNLPELAADTDLDPLFDKFYQQFLIYKLAERICQFNGLTFGADKEKTLDDLRRKIPQVRNIDTTAEIQDPWGSGEYNWGQINIGRGYGPG